MQFGNVQRGVLGVEGGELNSNYAKELGIKETQGFYINKVTKNSGAEKAGLTKGDIIVQLDDKKSMVLPNYLLTLIQNVQTMLFK